MDDRPNLEEEEEKETFSELILPDSILLSENTLNRRRGRRSAITSDIINYLRAGILSFNFQISLHLTIFKIAIFSHIDKII